MRLRNLIGFNVGPPTFAVAGCRCKLLLYAEKDQRALYESEVFISEEHLVTELPDVDFEHNIYRHSYLIGLQLIKFNDENSEWVPVKGWVIDLRHIKALDSVDHTHELVLRSLNGLYIPLALPKPQITTNLDPRQPSWFSWGRVRSQQQSGNSREQSLNYPTLVDLWTLQHSIDDARDASLQFQLKCDENFTTSSMLLIEKRDLLQRKVASIKKKHKEINEKTELLNQYIEKRRYENKTIDDELKTSDKILPLTHPKTINRTLEIKREQARLASELLEVFPIEPLGDGKFHFSIHGLMLPPVFAINHYDTTQVGAALGFVAQVVVCISRYLGIALTYPITIFGSQSFITDNISRIKNGSSNFPLWTRGVLLYRVEYALYLLHKNIEQLMMWAQLPVADLKQTLANLKNLLLVVSCNNK